MLVLGAKSCLTLVASHRLVTPQAPLTMEFSRQEYWNGLPFCTQGDLSDPGIKPESLASPTLAGRFFTTKPPGKPLQKLQAVLCYRGLGFEEGNDRNGLDRWMGWTFRGLMNSINMLLTH